MHTVTGGLKIKIFFFRFIRLISGLFLYSLGIVFTLRANIGYSPWDVFHVGLTKATGITIGMASILTGAALVLIVVMLGERVGMGTVINMLLIGVFLDMILKLGVIPLAEGLVTGVFMLVLGLFISAFATYFYISSSFGAGPRDSLMVAVTRKTNFPVGACRGAVELAAVTVGWFMGGMVGIGTIISAFGIGFCVQVVFWLLKFNVEEVKHETIPQTFRALSAAVKKPGI